MNNIPWIPKAAFYQPTAFDFQEDYDWSQGYVLGAAACQSLLPSPAGCVSYSAYRQMADKLDKPNNYLGWVNNGNVGWDDAIADGANWVWDNDPNSPHNKVS